MNNKLVSVCVTSYNRPSTIRQLIISYKNQSYKNKELIISDDTPSMDVIKNVVDELNDGSIRYFHNEKSLGFPRNFLNSLVLAKGDVRITIGDDDVFASKNALKRYVEIFERNPHVGFVYSNQYQFSGDFTVECKITKFVKDQLFPAGEVAVKNLLIHSVFIGGQAFRGDVNFPDLYPEKDLLHPQVQLVGNILATWDGFGISEYAIGVRSHKEQIIFRALKDETIKREGKHMNVELIEIFEALRIKWSWSFNQNFLVKQLIDNYPVVMIKEIVMLGEKGMSSCYSNFCEQSQMARESFKLRCIYWLSKILPTIFFSWVREIALVLMKLKNKKEFSLVKKQLDEIASL